MFLLKQILHVISIKNSQYMYVGNNSKVRRNIRYNKASIIQL